ncbi:MAG TPA: histidine kinase [Acidimicrobiales bacterium]|nr:histidine kinase [Acidimicrobiales bacterium]
MSVTTMAPPLRKAVAEVRPRLMSLARIGGLVALMWGVASNVKPGGSGKPLAVLLLLVLVGAAWLGWMSTRYLVAPAAAVWAVLAVLAGAGGALGALAPTGIGFPAVAALGAGIAFDALGALAVVGIGSAALAIVAAATAQPLGLIASGVLATFAGFSAGASRRQYQNRAVQAESLLAERDRADAERDRATALAERNRLGRDIHDVLAHSLGALAVQLEAADAVLEEGKDPGRARHLIAKARELTVEGLAEARKAVEALRSDPVALQEQLASLADRNGVPLAVAGSPQPVAPQAALALYRAAQEAITNARKHAPGSEIAIELRFLPDRTSVSIVNGPSPDGEGELGRTGGGHGLQGMRERLEEVGGLVSAGSDAGGFRVHAEVPA